MYIVVGLFLTFLCVWLVVRPEHQYSGSEAELSEALVQREKFIQILKDLELDTKTKKITQEEYQIAFSQIAKELEKIYKLIDG